MVAILEEVAGLVDAARAEINGQHHVGADSGAPVGKLMDADSVALGRVPGKVKPHRALLARADAVFPVISRDEVAARIAHHGDVEVLDQLGDVAAHAVRIGGGVIGLVDALVNGAPEMLEECPIHTIVDLADREVPMRDDRRFHPVLL